MCESVLPETGDFSEPLLAEATLVRSLPGVAPVVDRQLVAVAQHLAAGAALHPGGGGQGGGVAQVLPGLVLLTVDQVLIIGGEQ